MARTCHECKQPLMEIDNRGQRLRGCLTCNIWWSGDDEKVRLSEADLSCSPSAKYHQWCVSLRNSHADSSVAVPELSEVIAMANDQIQAGERDRSRVAGADDHVVRYLTEKYGLKRRWVQNLIDRYGNNRSRLEQAARELTGT